MQQNNNIIKQLLKNLFHALGYEISRYYPTPLKGTSERPIGNMVYLLEDLAFRGFKPDSVLDIGANQGDWSRAAKAIFPESKFFLIEPQFEMQEFLESFCEEFLDSRFFPLGVGSSHSQLALNVWDDRLGSSFLQPQYTDCQKVVEQRQIRIVTVDSMIDNHSIILPDLVKLDIQGFEIEALKGSQQLLGKTEVFIIEVSLFKFLQGQPIFDEVVIFMKDKGYVTYDFGGFLRRPFDGSLAQIDVCFVKENSFLRSSSQWF